MKIDRWASITLAFAVHTYVEGFNRNLPAFVMPLRRVKHKIFAVSGIDELNEATETTSSRNETATETASTLMQKKPAKIENSRDLDMPWSDSQNWALIDNLPRYTVHVPMQIAGSETLKTFTLWKSLCDEVPELAGYPLKFLMDRQLALSERNETNTRFSTEILPFLDDFSFEANGGLTGRVYGVKGVAEGTVIQTTPVDDVHTTVPHRFVRTGDGSVVYELGRPRQESYSLGIASTSISSTTDSLSRAISRDSISESQGGGLDVADSDLIRLGSLTAITLAGAFAFETLSHHLTINVFWV